ncbi:MAG: UDP-N-acetylmuramate dehydrogenase [Verrucomicrobiota bacterium]
MATSKQVDAIGLPAGKLLFIGIGGMGMAPLAGWMQQSGYSVCGYDDDLQQPVRNFLTSAGVELNEFLLADQVDEYAAVVYSSAVGESHPLYVAAKQAGLPMLRRGELLYRVAETKRFIAVVGSHGKTTTSGMIAHLIERLNLDVDYILGGFPSDPSISPSSVKQSEWLVAEVDESDGTIDLFSPERTVILNIDWDHSDYYGSEDQLEKTFLDLISRTKESVFVSVESGLQERFSGTAKVPIYSFGLEGDFSATVVENDEVKIGSLFRDVVLHAFPSGRFNQVNGVAALAVMQKFTDSYSSGILSDFAGIARRQTVLYRSEDLVVVEDYAHHPTEIYELLNCLRAIERGNQLVVVFQPHRYSRTRQFKAELSESLSLADQIILLPVYGAHEDELVGGAIEDLRDAFAGQSPEIISMDFSAACDLAERVQHSPTTLAFVGAGDIEIFAGVFTAWIRSGANFEIAYQEFLKDRLSPECVLKSNEPLANKTTMRVGGAARFYAEPQHLGDLKSLLRAAKLFGLSHFCMGRGSNLLVPDEGFDGLVIRFSSEAWRKIEYLGDGRFWVAAGARLKQVCGQAAKVGLAGFEFLEGIPGSVGGSLRMNAGAMGSWIFDLVERVILLDEEGRVADLPKSAFHFGYRKVEEISRGIALGAILKSPEQSEVSAIRECIDSYSKLRRASQPRDPSAGCIFKNPEGNYAGKLIDTHGIKGMRVGAAEVSDVHGNFIVNRGGATAGDVIELVRQVRAAVKEKSGYVLEPEVLLMGKSWDEALAEEKMEKFTI